LIEADARVIALDGDDLILEAEVSSTCGSCSISKGCGTSVFAKTVGKKFSRLRAPNTVNADIGDLVVMGYSEQALVRGSIAIYLLPIFGMMVSALAADAVLEANAGFRDGLITLAGIFGLALSVWLARKTLAREDSQSGYKPVVLRKNLSVGISDQFSRNMVE